MTEIQFTPEGANSFRSNLGNMADRFTQSANKPVKEGGLSVDFVHG